MELPVAIQQALDTMSPGMALGDAAVSGANDAVRMVLLSDDQGQVQAICRHLDLLDIAALNKQLGRDLRLLPLKQQAQLRERLGLPVLPALPALTGWPTFVDSAVDQLETVSLHLDGQATGLTLNGADFRALTDDAQRRSFCVPCADIAVNINQPEKDLYQLNSALKRFTGLRIQQRLNDTLELPPLPETAQRIIHLRVNPNAVMGDLVDIVESDPSLAAQVVSWASSSFYAAAGQVRSVHDAVSRVLGFDLVMNLAMGLALGRTLKQPEDQPEGFVGYWQQAIWQAQSGGILASMMPRGKRPAFGLAYLAGLLHNFGYLVLAQVFPPHFQLACRSWEVNAHEDTAMVEQFLLGITREQIGAQLMSNWGMPEEINVALRHQKNPGYDGEFEVYAKLLWLGRQLLTARGIPLGVSETIPDALFDTLGLDRVQVEAQFDELVESKDSIMAMAGMMQP
ncbi:aminoacyl-tRNA deacylase and HDOD domain-containing protein [Marinobacter caseinilyticus]|uniref:aminoacyl-tRNA deacylase and HDOD domain-containing protein n=1 Tax=Marinobacter caseinilyticus TaxID=2692195 RepID=UPI00140895B9|nr:HDOD domain-containing protein [Marinobacter caseinilyticus]